MKETSKLRNAAIEILAKDGWTPTHGAAGEGLVGIKSARDWWMVQKSSSCTSWNISLDGGNSNVFGIFTPNFGEDFPFWRSHLSKGWFNHQPDLFANSHLRNCGSLPLAIHIFSGRILWKAGRFSFGTPKNPGGLVMVFGTKNDTSTASPPDGERPSSQMIFGFRALFSRSRSPWW